MSFFKVIAALAGVGKDKADRMLAAMLDYEEIVKVEITKGGGKGQRSYPGYKLADPIPTNEVDAEEIEDDVDDAADY